MKANPFPKRIFTINQKMLLSLLLCVILPLFIVGIVLILYVYQDSLKTDCQNYHAKMEWICEQVDAVFLDGENIALTLYVDRTAQRYLKSEKLDSSLSMEISTMMNEQTRNKDYYKSICISNMDGLIQQWNGGTILKQDDSCYVNATYQCDNYGYWTMPHTFSSVVNPKRAYMGQVVTFYGKIYDYENIHNILGVVSVSFSEEYISKLYSSYLANNHAIHMIAFSNGAVLSSNDKGKLGKECAYFDKIQENAESDSGYFYDNTEHESCIVFYESSEKYDWYLVSIVPVSSFSNNSWLSLLVVFIAVFFCILFGICFGIIQRKTIIRPIQQVVEMMYQMPSGNVDYGNPKVAQDEIGVLYYAFRKMDLDMKEMIQRNYVSEIYRKEAELQMLISQINPHFLYNTLDAIYWMAIQNHDTVVANQIAELSDIFRHVLKTEQKFVLMATEIEFIQKYVSIMKLQNSNEIEFIVDVDDELLEKKIPRLLLQPLVENAFVHGIRNKKEKGCIIISAEIMEQKLFISVSDDGVGADEELINSELKGPGKNQNAFALKNVNKRIKLMFGEVYGMEFHSVVGKGTTAIIVLPQRMGDSGDEDDDY